MNLTSKARQTQIWATVLTAVVIVLGLGGLVTDVPAAQALRRTQLTIETSPMRLTVVSDDHQIVLTIED